jgi:hypothetical protein
VFTVPELPGAEAGTRAVTFRVERQGIVVLRQSLQYETTPKVQHIEPPEAAVGDVVALVGAGFADDPSRVRVRWRPEGGGDGGRAPAPGGARAGRDADAKIEAPVVVVIEGVRSAPCP